MQPWNFILIRDLSVKSRVKGLFDRERQAAACFYDEPQRSKYLGFKLEGIMEAPVNLCVMCDPEEFPEEPMLQAEHWRERLALERLVFSDRWGATFDRKSDRPATT